MRFLLLLSLLGITYLSVFMTYNLIAVGIDPIEAKKTAITKKMQENAQKEDDEHKEKNQNQYNLMHNLTQEAAASISSAANSGATIITDGVVQISTSN